MSKYLFVYGTLRMTYPHEMADFLRDHAVWVTQGKLPGRLYDVGTYPAVIPTDRPDRHVQGDLFLMHDPERVFEVLDPYEGVDEALYYREVCPVVTPSEALQPAWVYLFNRSVESLREIPDGDYLAYLKTRQS